MTPQPHVTPRAEETPVRQVIAPLTTRFTMANGCNTATVRDTTVTNSTMYTSCTAFQTSELPCGETAPFSITCYPHVTAVADIDNGYFYSPGLHCPADWETAMTVTSGQGAGTSMLSAISMNTFLSGETAAICCPRYVFHQQNL